MGVGGLNITFRTHTGSYSDITSSIRFYFLNSYHFTIVAQAEDHSFKPGSWFFVDYFVDYCRDKMLPNELQILSKLDTSAKGTDSACFNPIQ